MSEDENNANQREFDRLQGQIDDLTDIVATLVERAAGTPESEAAAPWSWRATTGERREALWGSSRAGSSGTTSGTGESTRTGRFIRVGSVTRPWSST